MRNKKDHHSLCVQASVWKDKVSHVIRVKSKIFVYMALVEWFIIRRLSTAVHKFCYLCKQFTGLKISVKIQLCLDMSQGSWRNLGSSRGTYQPIIILISIAEHCCFIDNGILLSHKYCFVYHKALWKQINL